MPLIVESVEHCSCSCRTRSSLIHLPAFQVLLSRLRCDQWFGSNSESRQMDYTLSTVIHMCCFFYLIADKLSEIVTQTSIRVGGGSVVRAPDFNTQVLKVVGSNPTAVHLLLGIGWSPRCAPTCLQTESKLAQILRPRQ